MERNDAENFFVVLRKCVSQRSIAWRLHALARMIERNVSRAEVIQALQRPKLLRFYPHDRPLPSALIESKAGGRKIYTVAAVDIASKMAYIITVWTEKEKRQ